MPGVEDRPKLHYTEAIIYEVLRLGTIAPAALPHSTIRDTTVGGYDVPKVGARAHTPTHTHTHAHTHTL